MPVLKYSDGEKSFKKEGGCLAIMGRYTGELLETRCLMDEQNMTELETVEFFFIVKKVDVSSALIDILLKYMSMFPFMRCVNSTATEILKTGHCVFNVKDYTQNEVMHAMFHIRALTYTRLFMFSGKGFTMLSALEYMTEKIGLPFWKAYLLCNICHNTSLSEHYGDVGSYVIGGDANTFRLKKTNLQKFLGLLRGEKPNPSYKGGTILENVAKREPYPQNISVYLAEGPSHKSLGAFFEAVRDIAQSKANYSGLKDAFGFPISETSRIDVEECHIFEALDEALVQYSVKEERFIC